MGTGKSAVGRGLARRLRRRFYDTDAWVTREADMSIPRLFERFGESAFRDLETQAAARAATPNRLVVSTGGGILARDENLDLLRRGGAVLCLTSRPEVILERTAPWENRPMLKTASSPREAVERLLAERAPRYALADWTLDTSDLAIDQVVDRICERLPSLYRIASTRS
jgi:shikimate kinase